MEAWKNRINPYSHKNLYGGNFSYLTPCSFELVEGSDTSTPEYRRSSEIVPATKTGLLGYREVHVMLSMLLVWHHATTEQLAYMTGNSIETTEALLSQMWNAGLVRQAMAIDYDKHGAFPSAPTLWTKGTADVVEPAVAQITEQDIQFPIHSGRPFRDGPRHERHNICSTEFACRLNETHGENFPIILGEGLAASKYNWLGSTRTNPDMIAIRKDGLKVAIEITTGTKIAAMQEKIAQWTNVLNENVDTAVLFVMVGNEQSARNVTEAAFIEKSFPVAGATGNRIYELIGHVHINELFETDGTPTKAFKGLGMHTIRGDRSIIAAETPFEPKTQILKRPSLIHSNIHNWTHAKESN